MDSGTFLRIAQYRVFWRVRAGLKRIRFQVLRQIFRIRYIARDQRTDAGILTSFVTSTATQFLVAVCITVGLELLELLLVPFLSARWPIPESSNYVSWLGSLAQIGGVFIALYFTAVTAAAGAIYATVPNNIRDLLTRERVGNIYIRYLTQVAFIPLCLIALDLAGFPPLRLALPVLVILAGTGIIAFAALGRRAFDLFDPTRLAWSLFADFGRWLDQVSAGGFRWKDPEFQTHAHRQANSVVDGLLTLADLAATHKNLESGPLLDFSVRIIALLSEYQRRKLRIPTDSYWFGQKQEHPSWYMTDDSTTSMAHQTGTTLNPTSVRQYHWFEDRVETILVNCFDVNIRRGRVDNVGELLSASGTYVHALARSGDLRRATALVERLREKWERHCSESSAPESATDIGIADALGSLQIQVLVAYRSAMEQLSPDSTINRIESVNWSRPESLYAKGFSSVELRLLEWIAPRLESEHEIEGKIRTPTWYIQDLVSRVQMEAMVENLKSVLERGSELQNWSDRLLKAGLVWQSAAVLARELEYMNKLAVHQGFLLARFEALNAAKHLSDLQWPKFDKSEWVESVSKVRIQLNRSMAVHIVLLKESEEVTDVPDYLGQFIHETAEGLVDVLLKNQTGEVQALFTPFLMGTFALFERMKPSHPTFDVWTERKLQVAAAPVIDLLELSGSAKLLAELHGEAKLWTPVATAWDSLLANNPKMLSWLAVITSGGMPLFQIPHRGLVRTNWTLRVQRELNQLPKRGFVERGSGLFIREEVEHPSPLVRYCAKYEFHDGWQIFAAAYLAKQPGGEKLRWGQGVSSLIKALDREEEEDNEEDDETSEEL